MPTPTPAAPASQLRRSIGVFGALGVMIGVIIGSGIFRTPPEIALLIDSPVLVIGLWILGGLVCLAGALTYAELAAMRPDSGGLYVFLRDGFGEVTAFVFGWSYLLLVKPFAAGGIAVLFGESVNALLGTHWDPRIATTAVLLSLTLINVGGVGVSTRVSAVLTTLKFSALALIVLLTILLGRLSSGVFEASPASASTPIGIWPLVLACSAAMASILWTYDGWADVGAIAGEVRLPQKNLPRVFIFGTLAVIIIYVLVNIAYFALVPLSEMRALAKASPGFSVAPLVAERLLGPVGSTVVTVVILLSTLGSSHASIMTGARVSYAQARDGLLFRFIGRVSPRFATPDASLFTQVALSIVAVWLLGDFQSLAEGFVFTMWIFYALGAAALIVLRRKDPTRERPFRCPGYPFVPLVFLLAAVTMTGLSIAQDPVHNLAWLGVLLAGVPMFYLWRRFTGSARAAG